MLDEGKSPAAVTRGGAIVVTVSLDVNVDRSISWRRVSRLINHQSK